VDHSNKALVVAILLEIKDLVELEAEWVTVPQMPITVEVDLPVNLASNLTTCLHHLNHNHRMI